MLTIACLHTAFSNVDVFEKAAVGLPVRLRHDVQPRLLQFAEQFGLTPALIAMVRDAVAPPRDADVAMLTCSTLGPAVEYPVLRPDQALAAAAVRHGGRVHVLYTTSTTADVTRAIFETAGSVTGAEIEFHFIEGAWNHFKRGELVAYHNLIARHSDRCSGIGVVALAQASMAGAIEHCQGSKPMTSPRAALEFAAERCGTA